MSAVPVRFGAFDHLDKSGRSMTSDYEERLSLVEGYDQAGFYAFHLAEHHGSPLGLAPSPSVFLAAVAARTKKLRFGPLVYTLPLYQPLRLIQEIGMLDQMSGGRLEIGVGRGIVAFETAFYGLTHLDTPPMFEEALEIIKAGLTSERLTYEGKFWTYRNVPMEIPPIQKPTPPLWYGVGRPDHGAWTAARGMNIVGNGGTAEAKAATIRRRRNGWLLLPMANGALALPSCGVTTVLTRSAFPKISKTPSSAVLLLQARRSMLRKRWQHRSAKLRPTICSAALPMGICRRRQQGAHSTCL